MATDRRRLFVLVGLFVILAAVLYSVWPSTSAEPATASNHQGTRPGAPSSARSTSGAPDVHLDALDGERPRPGQTTRDLFRFKPKAPPPTLPVVKPPPQPTTAPPVPTGPPPPPPVPPITLKFIGVMGTDSNKYAVLSDGRGAPFYGHEGEVVDGRYRILKIGVESIEIAYADGRGRQTIRLGGQ